jgi:hypothetical protein
VPDRIYRLKPDVKIIVVLREPVARAFSAWSMYKHFTKRIHLPTVLQQGYLTNLDNNLFEEFYAVDEFPSFEQVVEEDIRRFREHSSLEEPSVVRRGIYHLQIKRYFDLFGRENVLVLGFQDVIGKKKKATLNLILDFLGLPRNDWSFLRDDVRNMGQVKEKMPDTPVALLNDFYRNHNEILDKLLGFKSNW